MIKMQKISNGQFRILNFRFSRFQFVSDLVLRISDFPYTDRERADHGGTNMRYTRISADCHIDLCWLPPDLFTSNASAAMKDRMPYVTESAKGPRWVTKNGANLGLM